MSCYLDFSQLPENPEHPSDGFCELDPTDASSPHAADSPRLYNSPLRRGGGVDPSEAASWYVLLLLDTAKQGHTNVTKTTQIGPWLAAFDPTSEPMDSNSGEPSPANWRAAVIIEVGPDEALATYIISQISINQKGKQVRGAYQRGARADLTATLWGRNYAIDWQAALNLKPEEMRHLRITNYEL